jgi:small nuclear ribonucleoprotein (snRNP)-like protein
MAAEKVCCANGHLASGQNIMLTCSFRIVVGMLKGFDQLMNLVLDDVQEVMRGELDPCFLKQARHTNIVQTTKETKLIAPSVLLLLVVHYWSSYPLWMEVRKLQIHLCKMRNEWQPGKAVDNTTAAGHRVVKSYARLDSWTTSKPKQTFAQNLRSVQLIQKDRPLVVMVFLNMG